MKWGNEHLAPGHLPLWFTEGACTVVILLFFVGVVWILLYWDSWLIPVKKILEALE